MHCLNFNTKSSSVNTATINENILETNYRINDFNEFIKINRFAQSTNDTNNERPWHKTVGKIERYTRRWPLNYSESIVASISSVIIIF